MKKRRLHSRINTQEVQSKLKKKTLMEEDASAVSVGEAAVERYIKMVYKQQQRLTSADSRWIWVSCELCLPVYKEVMNGLRPHTTQGTIHKSNRRCSKNPE